MLRLLNSLILNGRDPMDISLSVISGLLSGFAALPLVGKYVAIAVSVFFALIAVVNSIVLVWHGLVMLMNALASVPGLSGLQKIADAMLADEKLISDFASNKLLPILNRLSAIVLPKA
jgi:hypothetical protein